MSRARANWLFVIPLVIVGIAFVRPQLTGGTQLRDQLADVAGLLLSICGLAIRIVARDWKNKYGRHKLVTTGIYSAMRHPLYVGSFMAGLGLCIILGSPLFLVVFVVAYAAVHFLVARGEEHGLLQRWPEQYLRYTSEVPACLPNPVRLAGALAASASSLWRLDAISRELSAVCGVLVTALLLDSWEDYLTEGWSRAGTEITAYVVLATVLVAVWMTQTVRRRLSRCA